MFPLLVAILFFTLLEAGFRQSTYLASLSWAKGESGRVLPLDGLRGLLAFSVFFSHVAIHREFWATGIWAPITTPVLKDLGSIPVLLFFFLSGFLFWSQIQAYGDNFPLKKFFFARARRILPAYYVSVFFVLVLSLGADGFGLRDSVGTIVADSARWLLFGIPGMEFPVINKAVHSQYFNAAIAWTLYYEWTFYFSLPLLRWFRKGSRVALLFAGLTILYFGFRRFSTPSPALVLWLGYLTYMLTGFGVGIIASELKRRYPSPGWLRGNAMAAAAVFCLGMAFVGIQTSSGPLTLIINRVWLMIFFFSVVHGNSLFGSLTSRSAQFLGKISYSFYVLHGVVLYSVLSLVNARWPIPSLTDGAYWSLNLVVAFTVVAVSAVSFRYVESPFLAARKPAPPKPSEQYDIAA